jgi:hypothetical protein
VYTWRFKASFCYHVTSPNAKEDLRITAIGTLKKSEWHRKGVLLCELTDDKQMFLAEIADEKVQAKVDNLIGKRVQATGTLKNGFLVINTLSESI